jgi:ribosomal protein S18 acetylase RimI-like enzyme
MAGPRCIRRLLPDEADRVGRVLGLARLNQGDGFYLVAWEDGEPIGHLHLALTEPPELQDVSVLAGHRRQGVARGLTEAAEREARARGRHRLRLSVGVDNLVAQSLYQSCGFTDAGLMPVRVKGRIQVRTGPIDVDDTLLVWEKALAD